LSLIFVLFYPHPHKNKAELDSLLLPLII